MCDTPCKSIYHSTPCEVGNLEKIGVRGNLDVFVVNPTSSPPQGVGTPKYARWQGLMILTCMHEISPPLPTCTWERRLKHSILANFGLLYLHQQRTLVTIVGRLVYLGVTTTNPCQEYLRCFM